MSLVCTHVDAVFIARSHDQATSDYCLLRSKLGAATRPISLDERAKQGKKLCFSGAEVALIGLA